jgi:hypothetical protein
MPNQIKRINLLARDFLQGGFIASAQQGDHILRKRPPFLFPPIITIFSQGVRMKKILVLAAFALSITACVSFTVAPPAGSVMLGERMVDFKSDHDVINVSSAEGLFRSLYFVVEKNDLEVFNLLVVYGNGEKEKLDVRLMFKAGSRSRTVDLHGDQRRIESIQFTYRTVGAWREGKARMIVYGVR